MAPASPGLLPAAGGVQLKYAAVPHGGHARDMPQSVRRPGRAFAVPKRSGAVDISPAEFSQMTRL